MQVTLCKIFCVIGLSSYSNEMCIYTQVCVYRVVHTHLHVCWFWKLWFGSVEMASEKHLWCLLEGGDCCIKRLASNIYTESYSVRTGVTNVIPICENSEAVTVKFKFILRFALWLPCHGVLDKCIDTFLVPHHQFWVILKSTPVCWAHGYKLGASRPHYNWGHGGTGPRWEGRVGAEPVWDPRLLPLFLVMGCVVNPLLAVLFSSQF